MRGAAQRSPQFASEARQQLKLLAELFLAEHAVPAVNNDVVAADHHRGGLAEDAVKIPDGLVQTPWDIAREQLSSAFGRGIEVASSGNCDEFNTVLVIRCNCIDDGEFPSTAASPLCPEDHVYRLLFGTERKGRPVSKRQFEIRRRRAIERRRLVRGFTRRRCVIAGGRRGRFGGRRVLSRRCGFLRSGRSRRRWVTGSPTRGEDKDQCKYQRKVSHGRDNRPRRGRILTNSPISADVHNWLAGHAATRTSLPRIAAAGYIACLACSSAMSSRRKTLPTNVLGSSSRNSMARGSL